MSQRVLLKIYHHARSQYFRSDILAFGDGRCFRALGVPSHTAPPPASQSLVRSRSPAGGARESILAKKFATKTLRFHHCWASPNLIMRFLNSPVPAPSALAGSNPDRGRPSSRGTRKKNSGPLRRCEMATTFFLRRESSIRARPPSY